MYAIFSDLHFHDWDSFSTVNSDGVNSRLQIIIDEVKRGVDYYCQEFDDANLIGRKTVYIAGDVFHIRGKLKPSVLNPVIHLFRYIVSKGVQVHLIPGNHDLESEETTELGSAIQSLHRPNEGCHVYTKSMTTTAQDGTCLVTMVPWFSTVDKLKDELNEISHQFANISNTVSHDLIIHAPVDGIIEGIPSHGLTPEYLANLSFRNVFAGHYHSHKKFDGNVYSIGATTHQTWNDVNSKAGFLIVYDDGSVKHCSSNAPSFVDLADIELNDENDYESIIEMVNGNYVRMSGEFSDENEITETKKEILALGAKNVVITANIKEDNGPRASNGIKLNSSVYKSLDEYILLKNFDNRDELGKLCSEIYRSSVTNV